VQHEIWHVAHMVKPAALVLQGLLIWQS
jgi:hypothetical protein